MKKILWLFTALFIITSCSLDPDPQADYYYEFLPTHSVYMPRKMTPGKSYKIKVEYSKPNGCYLFDRFYNEKEGESILIAVQAIVREDAECKKFETAVLEEATFTFKCPADYIAGSYVFKFYIGLDEQGNRKYEEVAIPVY